MSREMKDSGVEWIGQVPDTWKVVKAKRVFIQRSEKGNNVCEQLLSPTQKYGVIPQTLYEQLTSNKAVKLKTDTDFSKLKTIHKSDYCISLRSFQGGFEYSLYEGVVSPAYQVFYANQEINHVYYKYMFKSIPFIKKMNSYTLSLRDGKNISFENFANSLIPFPPLSEQQKIASFLDEKTKEIDNTIEKTKETIELYKKYKQSIIYKTVCKGIDNHHLKNTGSKYWVKIPIEWQMVKVKRIFEIVKRIAGEEGYTILSITQKGIKEKDISHNEGQVAADYSNYQFVYPGDFAMNHMDLLTGWVDISKYFGVTSPDYRVFRLKYSFQHDNRYWLYVMQTCYMNKIFYSLARGVSTLGRWRLQAESFNNFEVPVPTLEEQKQIADYLDDKISSIDGLINYKEKFITQLENYKKSLIYEYVTGKKEI